MSEPDIHALLEQLQIQVVDGGYQAVLNGRHFKIKPQLYEALVVLKAHGVEVGLGRICESWGLAGEGFEAFRAQLLDSIASLASVPVRKSYIHSSFTLLSAPLVRGLSLRLAGLFQRWLVWVVGLLCLLVFGDLFFFHQVGGSHLRSVDLSALDWLVSYSCIFGILLVHELGHAAAIRRAGQLPAEIGFGFYLVFPVFFANVSNAWLLGRRARFMVSLGGVYFQMLAAVLLYVGIALTSGHPQAWLSLAFKVNIVTALFVLIPFIRNDGYWLLADFLRVHDLYQRAGGMCWIVFQHLRNDRKVAGMEWFIAGYAICNYSFLTFCIWGLMVTVQANLSKCFEVIISDGWSTLLISHPKTWLVGALSAVVLHFLIYPFVKRAVRYVNK
jgi:putative peptide zinc metalloprotease protein